jgi:opacity protein-like surface antigen
LTVELTLRCCGYKFPGVSEHLPVVNPDHWKTGAAVSQINRAPPMKTHRIIVLFAALVASVAIVRADFYTKFGALYDNPGDLKVDSAAGFRASLKSNLGYAGSVGYRFSFLRTELELQYFKDSLNGGVNASNSVLVTSGDYKQYSGFVNAYLDAPSFFGVAPYVGAGLGMARISLDDLNARQGATDVVQMSGIGKAYSSQVMLGLQFNVLENTTVNAGYRFQRKQGFDSRNYASDLRQNVSLGTDKIFELGIAWQF